MTNDAHRSVTLLLAAFLLLSQGLLGPGRMMSLADPLGNGPICHAAPDDAPVPADHGLECLLCVGCHGPSAAVLPASSVFASVLPTLAAAPAAVLPPARAPPPAPLLAATYPTGPPVPA